MTGHPCQGRLLARPQSQRRAASSPYLHRGHIAGAATETFFRRGEEAFLSSHYYLAGRLFRIRLMCLNAARYGILGEVNDTGKAELLRGAAALLFPIDWPEPFGLVMIEAIACGTPVIAFCRGSVPEVIDEGTTGFIVDNEEEALAAIRRVPDLDRRTVRATFERRFTARRMANDYLRIYANVLDKWAPLDGVGQVKGVNGLRPKLRVPADSFAKD
jgi:glycosyltransferase involved in cell wall biosynthesis